MDENRQVPVLLTVVAILFIPGGISAVTELIVALAHRGIDINFGVLG